MTLLNKIDYFEKDICIILAQLAYFIDPKIIKYIQEANRNDHAYFKGIFKGKIDLNHYFHDGSACVFPGVRRYVGGNGERKKYNSKYKAIIDANEFPRHIWCFLKNGKIYNGPNWKQTGLNSFELAHIFSHKETETNHESSFFSDYNNNIKPYAQFTCASNVVLLPKGTVRPTDNSNKIKSAFYMRYIELYGENTLKGRSGFIKNEVAEWYNELKWNKPYLPVDWEINIKKLMKYRRDRINKIIQNAFSNN